MPSKTIEERRFAEILPFPNQLPETARSGLPLRAPGARGMPGSLEIARALRPLMRRIPSRHRFVLDVDATVSRIVDLNVWDAVLKPASARWLEVMVLVDTYLTMAVWRETAREFVKLLTRQGAFHEVRVWRLDTDTIDKPALFAFGSDAARHPRELINPALRRLILVVSDCSGQAWYGTELPRLLTEWGTRHPVAIVQMLPQKLWTRTGLIRTNPAVVHSSSPGLPNSRLRRRGNFSRKPRLPESTPIPVATLDKEYAANWAMLVAGHPRAAPVAVSFVPDVLEIRRQLSEYDAAERFRRFERLASGPALILARLFAAAPLSLPVMRLIQSTMLASSRQSHLAEVLVAEILERVSGISNDPELVQYEFFGDIRSRLLDQSRAQDSFRVLKAVLTYSIELHLGTTIDFLAWLREPEKAYFGALSRSDQSFARIAAQVLSRMGGRYAELADRLNAAAEGMPTAVPQTFPNVTGLVITDFGDYLQLLWEWPDGAHAAYVCWRDDDRFPHLAGEAGATCRRVTRGEYEQEGGMKVHNVPPGTYNLVVFAAWMVSGQEMTSSGQSSVCRKPRLVVSRRVRIRYDIRHTIFRRDRATVVLMADEAVEVGHIVVIARGGVVQPFSASDGLVVGQIGPCTVRPGMPVSAEINLSSAPRPGVLRLFFEDPQAYVKALFVDPPATQRKI